MTADPTVDESRDARLARQVDSDARQLDDVTALLAQVAGGDAAETATIGVSDPHVAVVRMAARLLGLRPVVSPTPADGIPAIAARCHVPIRAVDLTGDRASIDALPVIVEADDGPMLVVFTGEVARCWRPATGWTRVPSEQVTGARAWLAYPSLPPTPVTSRSLLATAIGRSNAGLIVVIVMGALVIAALASAVPIASSRIVGELIPTNDTDAVLLTGGLLLGVGLVSFGLAVVQGVLVQRLLARVSVRSTAALWDRVLLLDTGFFRAFTAGELNNRVLAVDRVREVVGSVVVSGLLAALVGLSGVVMLIAFSGGEGWPVLLVIALVVGYCVVVARRLARHQGAFLTATNELNGLFLGIVEGIEKIRVSAAASRVFARWSAGFVRQQSDAAHVAAEQARLFTVAALLAPVLSSMVVVVFVLRGGGDAAVFAGMSAAAAQVAAAFGMLVPLVVTLAQGVALMDSARPVLDAVPSEADGRIDPGTISGSLEFSGVEFGYLPEAPVLRGVTFSVEPGQLIAIVGPSGGGKSTIFRLLLGFETPSLGTVSIDGVPSSALDMRAVRRQIGVVLQQSQVPAGPLGLMVAGNTGASDEEIWAALRAAGLEADVRAMPMRLHTIVSEGGTTFSGGQVQRLMIARAIIGSPRVLLFDEATSALDNDTQDTVAESVARTQATRLVIAHRLSTIRSADRILVLHRGTIEESGTFDELMEKDGLFRSLAERQLVRSNVPRA